MGTHPIFESDFDCLTEKKIVEFVKMAAAFVDAEIANNEIVMFSKSWCPFCTKAKKALDSVGAKYKVIEIENRKDMAAIQDYLLKKTGGRSVPRVFIHGAFYGGGDETAAGARNGDLKKKINKE